MAIMTLSVVGLYNYDNTLFDGFNVPEGMDKNNAVLEILMQCAELELLYQDFDFMKQAITVWSAINADIWQKLYDTTQLDYNPIWNVDANITDKETRNLAGTDGGTRTTKGKDSSSVTTDGTLEHDVMGYNVGSYQHESKDTQHSKTDGSGTNEETATDSRNRTDTGTVQHDIRRTGNIGVTTSQQMIKEEREISRFNVYDEIVKDFKKRFCIMVY